MFAEDRKRLARFEREARLLASLNHPNICTLFDVGRERETSFIAMGLLEGQTLREHIGGKPLQLLELLELGIQIVDALAAMHENGIVHRDIKPSNVFVTDRGQAKLQNHRARRRRQHRAESESSELCLLANGHPA